MPIRTIVVSREEAGRPVVAILKAHLHLSWSIARRLVEQRRVMQGPRLCQDAQGRVRAGQKLRVRLEDQSPKQTPTRVDNKRSKQKLKSPIHARPVASSGPQPKVRYVDDQIVVVEKPAGLTTMRHAHEAAEFGKRGQRYLPTTLADLLPELLKAQGKGAGRVIAVHRLDRDTSGLVVFARNPEAARHLGAQFRNHTIDRKYLAIVRGKPQSERIETNFVPNRGDGRRGSGPGEGQRAVTHVHIVEEMLGFAVVECQLETGRTHQVRIHLGERGTPICGERVYDRPLNGRPIPDTSGAKRLALHGGNLAIEHPVSGKQMRWTAALPEDMERLLKQIRRQQGQAALPPEGAEG